MGSGLGGVGLIGGRGGGTGGRVPGGRGGLKGGRGGGTGGRGGRIGGTGLIGGRGGPGGLGGIKGGPGGIGGLPMIGGRGGGIGLRATKYARIFNSPHTVITMASRTSEKDRPVKGLINVQCEKAKPGAGDAKISIRVPGTNQ